MPYKRFKFLDLFEELATGALSPKMAISMNGVIIQPGTLIQKGVIVGGVDFHLFKYRDIAVADEPNSEGPLRVEGFFKD